MVAMSLMAPQQTSCWLRLKVLTLGPHLRRKQDQDEEDEDAHAENMVGSQLHRACLEAGRVGYVGYLSTSFFVSAGSLFVSGRGASPGSLRFLMPSLSRSRRLYSGARPRIAWDGERSSPPPSSEIMSWFLQFPLHHLPTSATSATKGEMLGLFYSPTRISLSRELNLGRLVNDSSHHCKRFLLVEMVCERAFE